MVKKKVTLRELAKIAKVSHTTVARVLNNDPGVRDETKRRILALADKYGYMPRNKEQELTSRKPNLLGLLVPDIKNPYHAEMARGIEDKAYEKGYNIIYCSTDYKSERLRTYVHLMKNAGVRGFIFSSARLHEEIIEKLIEERFPLVLVNSRTIGENYNYVTCDNFKGAYIITEYLIKLGYRKIALITGPPDLSSGIDRLKGYQQALKDYDIPHKKRFIHRGPFQTDTGYEATMKLLALKDRPEAIFAGSDYFTMGVIRAMGEFKLNYPEDMALVGFDDTDYAANQKISLTTVSQRKYEMGNLSVDILIDSIEQKHSGYIHKIVLEPELVLRESCGRLLRENALKKTKSDLAG